MNLFTRIGFQLLRRSGFRLTDMWDSWNLVLADNTGDGEHEHRRKMHHYLLSRQLAGFLAQYRIDLVVDVGAHIGRFAKDVRAAGYPGDIFSCEPNPEHAASLRAAASQGSRWFISEGAVGKESGSVALNISEDSSFASTLPFSDSAEKIFGHLVSGKREVIVQSEPLCTLVKVLEETTGTVYRSILLKSDTQGLDRQVVGSMGELLDRVKVLLVEVPIIGIYEGVGGLSEHNSYYESLGFRMVGAYPVSWTESDEVVEFDVVYLRKST